MEDNISEQGLKTRLLWLERAAALYDQYVLDRKNGEYYAERLRPTFVGVILTYKKLD